jgi:hypothetical protein
MIIGSRFLAHRVPSPNTSVDSMTQREPLCVSNFDDSYPLRMTEVSHSSLAHGQ